MSYTPTKLEKDRERRRRDEAEKEKKRKEEEEKKKKTKPPTPAEKYGAERVQVASPPLLTFLSPPQAKRFASTRGEATSSAARGVCARAPRWSLQTPSR
jgi:hypothetical protein